MMVYAGSEGGEKWNARSMGSGDGTRSRKGLQSAESREREEDRENHKTACLAHLLTGNDTNRACLTNGSESDHRLLSSVRNILLSLLSPDCQCSFDKDLSL